VHVRPFALYTRLPIDYIDAYNAALIEHRGQHDTLSFDHDFDRIAGLVRREELTEWILPAGWDSR
jgi:predicted nucleic acid-binding protein